MKRMTLVAFGVFLFLVFTQIALGADGHIEATLVADTAPTIGEWTAFLTAVAGWQGLGTLGVVGLVIQGFMLGVRHFKPEWKLLAVSGGSMVLGMTTLMGQGLDWKMAALHSTTLAAAQVFGYEVLKAAKGVRARNRGRQGPKETAIV